MTNQGIYKITHVASGRVYVGSAVRFQKRWWMHRWELRCGQHHSRFLQEAWNADGADAFTFSIIEHVADAADLVAREQHWIDQLGAFFLLGGFNVSPTAGSPLGTKHSEETRAKLRASWATRPKDAAIAMGLRSRGRILTKEHIEKMRTAALNMSPETKAKITASMMGRIVSAETRWKISEANKGQIVTQAQREAISAAHKGKVMSPEACARMSAARMGHPVSQETKEKIRASHLGRKMPPGHGAAVSAALKGKTIPPEVRAKISAAGKGHIVSPETRAKIGASNAARWAQKMLDQARKAQQAQAPVVAFPVRQRRARPSPEGQACLSFD